MFIHNFKYTLKTLFTGHNSFVDKIAMKAEPIDDNGTILYEEQPVIESIKIAE